MVELKKNDFIELGFTGYIKDNGEIFDSNILEDLKSAGHQNPEKMANPFIFPLGQDMFLNAVDEFLIGKDLGKYELELETEKAFGKRNPKFVQLVSRNVFKQNNVNPVAGMTFNFDGKIGKILSVNGGRIMIDFNNPIAGKDVKYKLDVIRKVEDLNEQIRAFSEFLFKMTLDFEVKDKSVSFEVPVGMGKFVEMFKDKFKEIFNLELVVKEKAKEEKIEKKEDEGNKGNES